MFRGDLHAKIPNLFLKIPIFFFSPNLSFSLTRNLEKMREEEKEIEEDEGGRRCIRWSLTLHSLLLPPIYLHPYHAPLPLLGLLHIATTRGRWVDGVGGWGGAAPTSPSLHYLSLSLTPYSLSFPKKTTDICLIFFPGRSKCVGWVGAQLRHPFPPMDGYWWGERGEGEHGESMGAFRCLDRRLYMLEFIESREVTYYFSKVSLYLFDHVYILWWYN